MLETMHQGLDKKRNVTCGLLPQWKKKKSNHIIVCLNTNTDGHPECLYYNTDKHKTPEIKRVQFNLFISQSGKWVDGNASVGQTSM